MRDAQRLLRSLTLRPVFASTVILTLALGVGVNTTLFSVLNSVLLRPLPYPASDRLVTMSETVLRTPGVTSRVAPVRLEEWHHLSRTTEALAGSYIESFTETSGPESERLAGAVVSPRFFDVLGVTPLQGRVFTPEDERFGGPPVVLISKRLWHRRFGGASAIGQVLRFDGTGHVIAGVLPMSVQLPSACTDVWMPKQASPGLLRVREARFYSVIGRLRPGVTPEQAAADLSAFAWRWVPVRTMSRGRSSGKSLRSSVSVPPSACPSLC